LASNILVEKRLVIAAGYLKQGPLHTIRKFIMENKSWDSFKHELVNLFGIKGLEHKYKDCMATINFSDFGCAEDYINKFMFYLQEVKISDSDAFYYFKRGLPEKYRLAFVGSNVRSVQEAVELSLGVRLGVELAHLVRTTNLDSVGQSGVRAQPGLLLGYDRGSRRR
jgi:hypothetical protein